MTYSEEHAIEAWKTFVSTGEVLTDKVRPDIAASWVRCKDSGLDPWSSDFEKENRTLLREKRERFAASLRSTAPVMQFLRSLLGANVSLMDGENFVFELFSPMVMYPRTYGTFMREEDVGTGNATLVAHNRKPVRIDGFEHYRAIAQCYSGVAAPYLNEEGRYYGAMNINSPFRRLPASALDLCVKGVSLTAELYDAGERIPLVLSTTEFFKPLLALYEDPVVLLDRQGRILNANAAMRPYCNDWDEYALGTQSLNAYLGRSMTFKDVLKMGEGTNQPVKIPFRRGRSRSIHEALLMRCSWVEIDKVEPFMMLVFEDGVSAEAAEDGPAKKSSERKAAPRDTEVMPKGGNTVDYIGDSQEWKEIDRLVCKAAPIRTNVLLLGETGTGKEVVARAIHRRSGRPGPFVAVNCGALPRDLLATELFGYEGGAFTGAREDGAIGKFEFADKGTIFLDEIGEMPIDMQVSLLRVLQESSVTKLGSNTSKTLDLRVLAATNQDIERMIAEKKFRSDLYYRLSMVEIRLPQLRKHASDIPLLVEYFNEQLSTQLNVPISPFPAETVKAFGAYSWPGNVRELRNMVERCLIMEGEGARVAVDTLPYYIQNAYSATGEPVTAFDASGSGSSSAKQRDAEEDARGRLKRAITESSGDFSEVAGRLGMTATELRDHIGQLGIKARIVLGDDDDTDDIAFRVRW